jgi:high-affinity Fe2+/Pb2+ permease
MKEKNEVKQYGLIIGIWIAVVIPIALWFVFNWKVAVIFFVFTQLFLMLCKLVFKTK